VIIGVDNVVILTKAVTSTSMELEVKERVAKGIFINWLFYIHTYIHTLYICIHIYDVFIGLEDVGYSITKNVIIKLLLLQLSCKINVDTIQEFCIFISVAVTADYLLQMSFYITTLSIDLRRLEVYLKNI
jgi:hypothetical protein